MLLSITLLPLIFFGNNAQIIRLNCGSCRYLRKEVLWSHLDNFADELLKHPASVITSIRPTPPPAK
ncbi:hypothetical protein DP113_23260 [Brasilonema octagenarum UFV-E1]|uniref:Uncharacterized protein n=1 Tax=Brasilonema sennae CENA114 TaxID=415709 RepID=A0A856MJH0_9CYAN|nr:hypothetical protein [Brasilonema sennae]QDL10439.1 hypothetical protein DP114_23355 [Brasilonema sennae CENA114]QDL16785.1 hypothetical protein DP113_23260 [Brasilonema octagenarum UFV-E1]